MPPETGEPHRILRFFRRSNNPGVPCRSSMRDEESAGRDYCLASYRIASPMRSDPPVSPGVFRCWEMRLATDLGQERETRTRREQIAAAAWC
jgi:hypothetical protein